ncbi:MAG: transcription repressor NadR [Clostridium sp.]
MNSSERRNNIIRMLKNSSNPISGVYIANKLNVSRQIIVGDVALLRASGADIIATPKGYILNTKSSNDNYLIKTIACKHSKDFIQEELNILVDEGITVINVIVEHSLYGQLTGDMHISSRRDVSDFMSKIHLDDVIPLSTLTDGIHLHTLKYKDEKSFVEAISSLKSKGYLL